MNRFRIKNIEDVQAFLAYVMSDCGLAWDFHPDNDFSAYSKPDADEPLFTEEEADILNLAIDECFAVCEKMHKDIYKLTMDYQIKNW